MQVNMRAGERMTAPAQPLMDYESGKGDPRKLLWAVGLSTLGIVIILPIGATLAIVCWMPDYGPWSPWAVLGHIVGWALCVLGITVAAVPTSDYLLDASLYRRRLQESFKLEKELRQKAGGVIVHEAFEEFQFYAERPNDMLLIITALTRRAAYDPTFRPTIATLTEDGIWVGNRKLGNVNTNQARKILTDLAEMGFINGRDNGAAGEWAYTDVNDAIDRYERKVR